MVRSIAAVASGRPAPRYASIGVVLVTNEYELYSILAMSYTPPVIIRVMMGNTAPIHA